MKIHTNIFEILFDFDEFHIQRLPWEEGRLEKLRSIYNHSHSFFRNGDFIYVSSGQPGLETLGEVVTVKINEDPSIVSSLLRHVFFRTFKNGFPEIKPTFYPFTFPSRKEEHNLIAGLLPDTIKTAITYRKLNEIYIKWGELNHKKAFFLVIDSSYKWALRYNCNTLHDLGFNLSDLEVARLKRYDASDNVTAPSFESIGRIKSIEGRVAILESNNGELRLNLKELFLNKSVENIRLFLEFSLGQKNASDILQKVKEKEFLRNDPLITHKEISEVVQLISKLDYKNYDGFSFRIENRPVTTFPQLALESPRYLFDVSLTKSDTSPSRGLNTYGPYDYGKFFEINNPKVLVICHSNSGGAFSQFLAMLKEGLPESDYFSKGFVAKYRLQDIQFKCIEINSYSKESYINALRSAVSISEEYDIAIIETKDEFKKLTPLESPYWVAKSFLLQKGITVQFLKESNARNPKWIIDSFALQMYAKLGGTAWTLPASPNIAHELIVGIGSLLLRNNMYSGASQSRVVGITTFFNSDGRYLLSSRSREVAYDNYFQELLSNLKDSINRISAEQGWSEGAIVRIVFHVFKPMKNIEVDVVANLISEYPHYNIKFAFISFGERHPYLIFDLEQQGVKSRYNNFVKGKLVPARGTNFVLEQGICLLQLKGPKDVKSDKQGMTTPLLIKIHPKSTFTDTTYLVQQVFRLTNISFRSFTPSQLPITLFYASLITEQLNNLSQIEGWNPEFIKQLRNKKWFI